MLLRGKVGRFPKHAVEGMRAERPPVRLEDVELAIEEPDHDDGTTATKRIARRTIIVRYDEDDVEVFVRSVSATRSRLAP